MNMLRNFLPHRVCLFALLLITQAMYSQTIVYSALTKVPVVCQQHTQAMTLIHTGQNVLDQVAVTVHLPCGFQYVPGTVTGIMEDDLSDLQHPVFQVDDVQPGSVIAISMDLFITCDVLPCLAAGEVMNTTVSLIVNGSTVSFPSDPFNVETPRLVITKVVKSTMTAAQGQTIIRTITVRNTRIGRLASFRFTDVHADKLAITSPNGTDGGSSPQSLVRIIGSADFQAVGNHDGWLDFNEEIVLTESILITDCSFDHPDALSTIRAGWGCGTSECQAAEVIALVHIEPLPEKGRVDSIVVTTSDPICYDGENYAQEWTVKNTSKYSTMTGIELAVEIVFDANVGFVPASFSWDLDGQPVLPDSLKRDTLQSPCGEQIAKGIRFFLPPLGPGQTLRVPFDLHICAPASCTLFEGGWVWTLSYEKTCAAPGDQYFSIKDSIFNNNPLYTAGLGLTGQSGGLIEDGQQLQLFLTIPPGLFDKSGAGWTADLFLPCGFVLQDSSFLVDGIPPLEKKMVYVAKGQKIHLKYPLPMPVDTAMIPIFVQLICDSICTDIPCEYSLVSSCEDKCQGPVSKISLGAEVAFFIGEDCPLGFNPRLCLGRDFGVNCFNGECPDTLTEFLDHILTMERVSFGLPDNDNDYLPDPGGQLDFSKIRTDRAMPGDTIRLLVDGVVRAEDPTASFESVWIRLLFGNRGGFPIPPDKTPEEFLDLLSGFKNLYNHLEVKDPVTGVAFDVPVQIEFNPYDSLLWFAVHFDSLAAAHPEVPKGFRIGDGDTLRLSCFYRLDRIFRPYPPAYQRFAVDIGAQSNAFVFNGPFSDVIERKVCPCPQDKMAYTCIDADLLPNAEAFPVCQEPIMTGMALEYGILTNFFPHEYRTLIDSVLTFCLDGQDFVVDSARVVQVRINGKFTTVNLPLTVTSSGPGNFCLEMNPAIMGWQEEDNVYYLELDMRSASCERQTGGKPTRIRATMRTYADRSLEKETEFTKFRLFPQERTVPTWHIVECVQSFFTNEVGWDILVANCFPATDNLVPMQNTWMKPTVSHQALESLTLTNVVTGQVYPFIDDRFRLGEVGVCDTLRLRLTGTNTSCDHEKIYFDWGWSCDSTDLDATCRSDWDSCGFYSPPGQLEMMPDTVNITADLCTPMPISHSLHTDADLGAVYLLTITAVLPKGLNYIPGTSAVRWPAGTGSLIPIDDPDILPDGRLEWIIDSLLAQLAGGLPGELSTPDNTFDLEFQTLTECGFISGTKLIYTFRGEQVCERPTNIVTKLSGLYTITGTSAPFGLDIAVSLTDTATCQENFTLEISIPAGPSGTDPGSLTVELPAGFGYLPGSTSTNLIQQEPLFQGNRLIWKLDPDLPLTTVSLSLTLSPDAPCAPLLIPVYTTVNTTAICETTGQECGIETITGSRYVPVTVERPEYLIPSVKTVPWFSGTGVEAVITQITGKDPGEGEIELWLDLDGDGTVSSGDVLKAVRPFMISVSGSTSVIFGPLDLQPLEWCRVLVRIDEDANCTCGSVLRPLETPATFAAMDRLELCWADSVQLGGTLPGGVPVVWTGAGLSCTDCTMPWYYQVNSGSNIESTILLAQVSPEPGCQLIHEWIVDVYPKPALLTGSASVCAGDTATLLTTPAASWTWSGPEILPGAGQVALMVPENTSTYSVTITDGAGCVETDTAVVTVLTLPDIAGEYLFCAGTTPVLSLPLVPGVVYFWKNAGGRLNNPTVPNPTVIVPQDFDFLVEMNNGYCTNASTVSVRFQDSLLLNGLPDTVRACIGDTLQLTVLPDVACTWEPAASVICLNPNCSSVGVPVEETVVLSVTGTDSLGCTGVVKTVVVPEEKEVIHRDTVALCPGESIDLFGQTVTEAGWYCDTTGMTGSCLEITCVLVRVGDTLTTDIAMTICEGQSVILFGETFTEEGTWCRTTVGSTGCDSTVCLTLTVIPDPVADLVANMNLCVGDTAWIMVNLDPDNTVFSWTDGWPDLERPVTPINTYVLILKDACGQPDSAVLAVDTWPPPIPDLGPDTTFCQDSFHVLQPLLPEGTISWMWSDSFPELERPVSEEGWYTLLVTDSCGQTGVDSVFFTSAFCGPCEWDIPNVFTPNSDGVNDVFRVYKNCDAVIHMRIYDRWGQVVFDETGPDPMWNGVARGVDQPMEVYAYVITLTWTEQGSEVRRGDVTLVR